MEDNWTTSSGNRWYCVQDRAGSSYARIQPDYHYVDVVKGWLDYI